MVALLTTKVSKVPVAVVVIVVKEGVLETAIVEVPEIEILEP